jgi:hypothetical protein
MFIVATFFSVQAQKNVIKTNPLALAFGNFNVTYEKVLNESSSLLITGNYSYQLLGFDVSLGGLGAGYRYYITHIKKEVPKGFYVAPEISFGFGKSGEVSVTSYGIGAQLGYQWVWSGFALDLGIGPRYTVLNGVNAEDSKSGILPAATFAIGYAF